MITEYSPLSSAKRACAVTRMADYDNESSEVSLLEGDSSSQESECEPNFNAPKLNGIATYQFEPRWRVRTKEEVKQFNLTRLG